MSYLTDKMSHFDGSCNSDYVVLKIVLLNFLILIMNSDFIYIFTKRQYFMSINCKCDLDIFLTHYLLRHVLSSSSLDLQVINDTRTYLGFERNQRKSI